MQGESAEAVTAETFLCAVSDLAWQYCQQQCRGQPGREVAVARRKRGPSKWCIWLERLSLRHVQDIQVGTAKVGCTIGAEPRRWPGWTFAWKFTHSGVCLSHELVELPTGTAHCQPSNISLKTGERKTGLQTEPSDTSYGGKGSRKKRDKKETVNGQEY